MLGRTQKDTLAHALAERDDAEKELNEKVLALADALSKLRHFRISMKRPMVPGNEAPIQFTVGFRISAEGRAVLTTAPPPANPFR